jgi:hypothetical protein
MAQQTAVQWLALRYHHRQGYLSQDDIAEAKEIEKEKIMKAFSDGQETPINNPTTPHYSKEEYYNETYNNGK